MDNKEEKQTEFQKELHYTLQSFHTAVKWVILGAISGIIIGLAGTAFGFCVNFANDFRQTHPYIIWLLPLGGVLIVGIYRLFHNENDGGTDQVISAVYSDQRIPLRMAPSIFISTVITHLLGGSAGRTGAALQIGGSLSAALGRFFKLSEKDNHIMIMCGMSAAFATLFGTPMAAAVFSMEVISVGVMYYAALVPCAVSALISHAVTEYFGLSKHLFRINETLPAFSLNGAGLIILLAILCALVSILFCVTRSAAGSLYKKYFPNPYLRAFAGGCSVLILTLLSGSGDYNGAGMPVIVNALNGSAVFYAFLLKIILTSLTLGAGFKGGEVAPSFFIGATFGCLFGTLAGFSPMLCAAAGMTSVFCGVTNCPIASLLISFEMFGFEGMPYYLLACAFSYMFSGYFGLYHTQKMMYSKLQASFINQKTR